MSTSSDMAHAALDLFEHVAAPLLPQAEQALEGAAASESQVLLARLNTLIAKWSGQGPSTDPGRTQQPGPAAA